MKGPPQPEQGAASRLAELQTDFLVEEYKQVLALRESAASVSANRINVFFTVMSVATLSIALVVGGVASPTAASINLVAVVLAGLGILGAASFLALCEHHVSQVRYLRAANALRGEISTRLDVAEAMVLPTSPDDPPMGGTGPLHRHAALLISVPSILGLMTAFLAAVGIGLATYRTTGLAAAYALGVVVFLAVALASVGYQEWRFARADAESAAGRPTVGAPRAK